MTDVFARRRSIRLSLTLSVWGTAWALALPAVAEEYAIGGSGTNLGAMRILAEAYAARHPGGDRFTVLPSMGSSGGVKAVTAGAVALGVTSRPLKADEAAAGATAREYARTPFVFAAAATLPVEGLATADIAEIYAGRLAAWPDGTRIRMVLRPASDSDNDAIRAISPAVAAALKEAEARPGMAYAVTDQETARAIASVPGGIGPSTLALVRTEDWGLKALALDGVAPAPETIADGRYPWFKSLYVVTSPRSPAAAHAFVAFVRSDEGRAILARTGHWVP